MNRAVIDIGTNSSIILIAGVENLSAPLFETSTITRLGEGLGRTGKFSGDALQRNLDCLESYKKKCDEFNVSEIRAVSTSAARDSANTQEFITIVKKETGINIKVLSGDEEASYSFAGGLIEGLDPLKSAMLDIGGGSTEIVSQNANGSLNKVSMQLGGVRCLERYFHSDPPSLNDLAKFEEEVKSNLEKLNFDLNEKNLFGVGGTFTALARVKKKLSSFEKKSIHNSILTFQEVKSLYELFKSKSISERKKIQGMEEKRADIILAGAGILNMTMEHFNFKNLIVSANGLRYGVFKDERYSC